MRTAPMSRLVFLHNQLADTLTSMSRHLQLAFFLLFCWIPASAFPAIAAETAVGISASETYVGAAVTLQVRIANAVTHKPPEISDVDGLKIESAGEPARSSQITIINGRRSENTSFTYTYAVTPQREGEFTIPPIRISADGIASITKATRIVATKSETGNLMFVEVYSEKSEVFVGEPVELTLKVFLRPYRNREQRVALTESEMWQLFSEQTNWGVFQDKIDELEKIGQQPRGDRVLKKDDEGQRREYFLYTINATVYPDRVGPIEMDDLNIIFNYPVQIGRTRSPFSSMMDDDFPFSGGAFSGSMFGDDFFQGFGGRKTITKVRPLTEQSVMEDIIAKPVPTEGRPDTYRGAVGRYAILTEADPVTVKAGDPIELRIYVRGTGPMDLVEAPPLDRIDDLTKDFKVNSTPLAGYSDGDRKLFATTIRPLREGINRIPPIPLTYFDPGTEDFETTESSPIPIRVLPADKLELSGLKKRAEPEEEKRQPQQASLDRLLGIKPDYQWKDFNGSQAMAAVNKRFTSPLRSPLFWFPPLAFTMIAIAKWLLGSPMIANRKSRTLRRIEAAKSSRQVEQALLAYLQQKFRSSSSASDGTTGNRSSDKQIDEVLGLMRSGGADTLANQAERIFNRNMVSAEDADLADLQDRARSAVESAHQTRLIAADPARNSLGTGASLASSALALVFIAFGSVPVAASEEDTSDARERIAQTKIQIDAAKASYVAAGQSAETLGDAPEPSEVSFSNRQFEKSAAQLQAVVRSGSSSPDLFQNLANAQFRAGKTVSAIANYYRGLKFGHDSNVLRVNLIAARQSIKATQSDSDTTEDGVDASPMHLAKVWLAAQSSTSLSIISLLSWVVLWGLLTVRLFRQIPYLRIAIPSLLLIASLTAGIVAWHRTFIPSPNQAVIAREELQLRQGDDSTFPIIAEKSGIIGELIDWSLRRGNWVKLRFSDGTQGWVEASAVEIVS